MIASTSGEKLFALIKNEILPAVRSGNNSWNGLNSLMEASVGEESFVEYVKGATSIYIVKKLLYFWRHEKNLSVNEAANIKTISKFIGNSILPSLEQSLTDKISRFVVAANLNSGKDIPKSVRKQYKDRSTSCYLCGEDLDMFQADDSKKDFFTLEHLWPSSLGGDSIDENLLPACKPCQDTKMNYTSWEWYNVQNAVWSVTPSENELKRVPFPAKISRHYFEAILLAEEQNIRLKDAFLKLGPIASEIHYISTKEPITFFDLRTA